MSEPSVAEPISERSEVAYKPLRQVGRYELFEEIASGGFAAVHLARTLGAGGFSRTVAIKRLHAQYAKDPEVVAMFLDEARVVARIRHPNVLPTIDFVQGKGELMIVMEYVQGVTLGHLLARVARLKGRLPVGVALRIICGALQGLQAAHDAKNEQGELLGLIHRDVTPENIMVGADGLPRLLDFGVARALGGFHSTREGEVKGKLSYLAPEQVMGDELDQRTDVYSASVVLWEALVGRKLFRVQSLGHVAKMVLEKQVRPPSDFTDVPRGVDEIVMRGLSREPDERFQSAAEMAKALERVRSIASTSTVGQYVSRAGKKRLDLRASQVAVVESTPLGLLLDEASFDEHGENTIMALMSMEGSVAEARSGQKAGPPLPSSKSPVSGRADAEAEPESESGGSSKPSSQRADTLADAASSRDNIRDSLLAQPSGSATLRRAAVAAVVLIAGLSLVLLSLGPDSGAPLQEACIRLSTSAQTSIADMVVALRKEPAPKAAPTSSATAEPTASASAAPSASVSASAAAIVSAAPKSPTARPTFKRPLVPPRPPSGGSGLYGRE